MFRIIITTILCESFHAVGQERFSGIVRFQCEMCFSFCKFFFVLWLGDSIASTKKVGCVYALV